MKKDCEIIWNKCLALIKPKISPESYQTWFASITPHKYENNTLTIVIPNQFFYEWLEGHYIDLLQEVINTALGPKGKLAYQVKEERIAPSPLFTKTIKANPKNGTFPYQSMPLNPAFTFAYFIVGDCNQLAQAAAQNVAYNPGVTSFNPLMIHSDIGLGKSHIVQAIAHYIQAHSPEKRVAYITTEKFTAQLIQKIRENKIQSFIDAHKNFDMIIIDDIQFFGGKEKTQEIFFHIFNELYQSNKQIIMTSDTSPSDLQGFQKRILSRFRCGLTVDLQKPDVETKIAILESKLAQRNFHLKQNLIQLIARQVTSNIRELEGVLTSLIGYADLKKKAIDEALVQQVIDSVVEHRKSITPLDIKYLQKIVASHYNLSLEQLKSKSRKREVITPRQLVMYFARKFTNNSLKAIAYKLGYKDHSTVTYAITTIRNLMNTDRLFRTQVEALEKMIKREIG